MGAGAPWGAAAGEADGVDACGVVIIAVKQIARTTNLRDVFRWLSGVRIDR